RYTRSTPSWTAIWTSSSTRSRRSSRRSSSPHWPEKNGEDALTPTISRRRERECQAVDADAAARTARIHACRLRRVAAARQRPARDEIHQRRQAVVEKGHRGGARTRRALLPKLVWPGRLARDASRHGRVHRLVLPQVLSADVRRRSRLPLAATSMGAGLCHRRRDRAGPLWFRR